MDPKARKLLDFISIPESRGKYDVIYGFRQNRLAKPITQMTLGELIEHQKVWGQQWGSSAAGKYQIIRPTLEGLVRQLNLPLSIKFDEKTQDLMGLTLLEGRGWYSFLKGNISVEKFALNLAKEWASLPVLKDTQGSSGWIKRGQSYYSGDGLNNAHVDADEFEGFLRELRGEAPVPKPKPVKEKVEEKMQETSNPFVALVLFVVMGLIVAGIFLRDKIKSLLPKGLFNDK